jgi:DNA-binding MarR family transcriptional regulator
MQTIDRAILARRALLDTLRVANLLDRRGGALARREGITSAQWLTLGLLAQVGDKGMTPTELCRQLCVSKQNMTGMIVRLEKKNLIERRPEPRDRRSFRVAATEKGAQMVQNLEAEGRDFFERQVARLEPENLVVMSEGLALVLEALREEERADRRARGTNGS